LKDVHEFTWCERPREPKIEEMRRGLPEISPYQTSHYHPFWGLELFLAGRQTGRDSTTISGEAHASTGGVSVRWGIFGGDGVKML
jgi:hypothetical protein